MFHGLDFIIFLVITINAFLSAIILSKNKKSKTNQFYAIFVTILNLWILSNFLENEPTSVGLLGTEIFLHLDYAFAIIGLYFWFRFSSAFAQSKLESPPYLWINKWLFLISLVFMLFSIFTPFIVTDVSFYDNVIHFKGGLLWPLHTALVLFFLVGGLVILWTARIKAKTNNQSLYARQIDFVLLGFAASLGIAMAINAPQAFYPISLETSRVGLYGMVFLTGSIAYAIARYRLMDIKLVIRGGVIASVLFGIITFIFILTFSLFPAYFPRSISALLSAFLITILFNPLKKFLEKITDKLFFQKQYQLDDAIKEFNHILIRTVDLKQLLSNLFEHLRSTLKIKSAVAIIIEPQGKFITRLSSNFDHHQITLDHNSAIIQYFESLKTSPQKHKEEILYDEELERNMVFADLPEGEKTTFQKIIDELSQLGDFSLALPISSKEKILGVFLLGKKQSRDPFSEQDLNFLDILIHEMSVTIENALNLERILQLDEAKSEFISVVSHQLRTPLSVMRWSTELVIDGVYGKIKNRKIKNVISSSYEGLIKLNDGLNNLLLALEVVEEKTFLNVKKFDFIEDVLMDIKNKFKKIIKKKGLRLLINNKISELPMEADLERIKYSLSVIVSNAILYNRPGGSITISVSKDESKLSVSVEDEGIGVCGENQESIFTRFFRGAEARRISPDGLGVSLFVARSFIERNEGKLLLDEKTDTSKPGAKFTLTLPIKKITDDQVTGKSGN